MSTVAAGPVFRLDRDAFAAGFGRRPVAVDHTLAEDPLLSLEAIADLADRFPGRVESHTADQPLVMPGGAPELELSPSEIVRGIEDNGCWMVFWYIHQDPAYKALLDRCLDKAESYLPSGAGRAIQREAFLFLSAPMRLPDPLRSRAQLPASDPRAQGHERLPLPLRGGGAPRT